MNPKVLLTRGFTLLELLVAIASSTVILGGFLIAFSSLNKTSKLHDDELRNLREGATVRMTIEKALAGASNVNFNEIETAELGDVNILYYYKYDDKNLLTEYGYFFIDEQRGEVDPSYQERTELDGSDITVTHLFFNKIDVDPTDPKASAAEPPNPALSSDFPLIDPQRQIVVHDATDFRANISQVDTQQGDKRVAFNVDYQVSTAYFAGGSSAESVDRRERVFKGSSYALGKITG